MVTSRDVARIAGVSQATVSRVLHDSDKVTPATRARVLAVLRDTGYAPNLRARAMRTGRMNTVGVVVARIRNPFYPELLEALGSDLGARDQRMVLWESGGGGEDGAIDAIGQGLVDGLVFTTVTGTSRALEEALRNDAPIVLVNRGLDDVACDQVASANRIGAWHVAQYFALHGRRDIAFIGGPLTASTAREREEGFRQGLADHGLALPDDAIARRDFSHEGGREAMQRLLDRAHPPRAVFCVNDLTAFGALDGARAAGVAVPDELWVVGYDDIAMASWAAFDLTTVRQSIPEMSRLATELLLARVADPGRPPVRHRLPDHLVVRGTTAHAPFASDLAGVHAAGSSP